MNLLNTQTKLRKVRGLPFCYLCGVAFKPDDLENRDHVPPQSLFASKDRNFPLILRAHKTCNSSQSRTDELSVQLLGLKLGRIPQAKNRRLTLRFVRPGLNGPRLGVMQDFHVEAAIRRWLRGFHAALYEVPMPTDTLFAIQTPFPSAQIENEQFVLDELRPQHLAFVHAIKRNRLARNFDGIHCNNGKLRYECVWEDSDDGRARFCVFALNLYDWIDLGDVNNFQPRGCAGMYWSPTAATPNSATRGTRLEFDVRNRAKADPFAE
jgi:hypothetical protein